MKLKIALAAASLAMVFAGSARADLVVGPTTKISDWVYDVTLFGGSSDTTVGGDSISPGPVDDPIFDWALDPTTNGFLAANTDKTFEFSYPGNPNIVNNGLPTVAVYDPNGGLLGTNAAVPEPGTVAMFLSAGVVGAGFLVRRRK